MHHDSVRMEALVLIALGAIFAGLTVPVAHRLGAPGWVAVLLALPFVLALGRAFWITRL